MKVGGEQATLNEQKKKRNKKTHRYAVKTQEMMGKWDEC